MNSTTKEQALNRISVLEEETKQLKKIIQTSDSPKNIMEMVKTLEDACEIAKRKIPSCFLESPFLDRSTLAFERLKIIVRSLNYNPMTDKFWVPDWTNTNEYKYWAWFNMRPSGFGFSDTVCVGVYTATSVGSRLCFKSRELAEYAAKQFEDIYKDYLC